jgi:hypothetical protein
VNVNLAPGRRDIVPVFLLLGAAAAVCFRLWTSFCFFPLPEWNAIRLAPTFMLRFGPTPYPGLEGGAVTTWIYGPVPLLLNLPATLARDMIAATLAAGIINILCSLLPIALVAATIAPRSAASRSDRMWVLLLGCALWPNTSWQFIQADNVALGFGLIANCLLSRAQGAVLRDLLLAALCAALAVWSKQTYVGLVLAQSIWLWAVAGPRTVLRYALIFTVFSLLLGGMFVAWFGFGELWLNLVQIPGRLPMCPDLMERAVLLWKDLAGGVLLPLAVVLVFRRVIWAKASWWLLPALSWLCLLPTGLMAAFKIGGASNSLNGYLFLVAPAMLALVFWLQRVAARTARAWSAAALAAVLSQQMSAAPLLPLQPITTHLAEATHLAQKLPQQIYFPWHPLATWYAERRFYHTEDGLYTRGAARLGPAPEMALQGLPARWSMTAVQGWRENGVFRELEPASLQRGAFGKWTLHFWPAPENGPLP